MLEFAELNKKKCEIWKDGIYIGLFICGKDGKFSISTMGIVADDFRQIADKLDELNKDKK